ncbi:hypothetical protein F2Q69_00022638 [Brassica cretica]|uniref:Uncharacterized protein n=1 Tax=Brassica cretica TaxID=69181 RepID=A0A8S9Q5E8_BRACR|nr:hypothetical protein F2Q69_00022638 [Brassica cretica]
MEGSPYRKFSFPRGMGAVLGTGPGELHSGEPGFLLAGTQSLPLIARFRHRTRGITCALKSTGIAHSQQEIAPVILKSRVPLRPEPHSEPGGGTGSFTPDRGLALLNRWFFVGDGKLWASGCVLETVEHGALMFHEEELMC